MSKKTLFEKAENRSAANVHKWKAYALNHIRNIMRCSQQIAEDFFSKACSRGTPFIVLNLSAESLVNLLVTGQYAHENNEIKNQAKSALGISDCHPIWASLTYNVEGNRKFGPVSLILEDVKDYLVFQGDASRLRDPSRVDFLTDPEDGLFLPQHQNECRAVATILSMGPSELSGIETAEANLYSKRIDFGRCTALIFDDLKPENISKVYVPSEEDLQGLRKLLGQLSKALPVEISDNGIRQKDPFSFREEKNPKTKPSVQQRYFQVGDRICTKSSDERYKKIGLAGFPLVSGTILDISNGRITVQWDNEKKRSILDMAEALMSLVAEPQRKEFSDGDVIYTTPGMSSKDVKMLSAFGLDPVTIYSIASHSLPYSNRVEGWKDVLKKNMQSIGLRGDFRKGYVETETYFEPREWFEAKLASGLRLIVDYTNQKLKIEVGEAEDYVVPQLVPLFLEE